MNGKLREFAHKYWWKILALVFSAGVLYTRLSGQVETNAKDIDSLKTKAQEHREFIVAQIEINRSTKETLGDIQRDIKSLLRRRERNGGHE